MLSKSFIRNISFKNNNIIRNYPTNNSFSTAYKPRIERYKPKIKRSSEPPGYMVHVSPGSRVIELNKADDGNYLTSKLMTSMENKIESYTENIVANFVFVHSFARYKLFSKGFEYKEYTEFPEKCILSAQSLATAISKFPKPFLASYSGYLNGTAYAGKSV